MSVFDVVWSTIFLDKVALSSNSTTQTQRPMVGRRTLSKQESTTSNYSYRETKRDSGVRSVGVPSSAFSGDSCRQHYLNSNQAPQSCIQMTAASRNGEDHGISKNNMLPLKPPIINNNIVNSTAAIATVNNNSSMRSKNSVLSSSSSKQNLNLQAEDSNSCQRRSSSASSCGGASRGGDLSPACSSSATSYQRRMKDFSPKLGKNEVTNLREQAEAKMTQKDAFLTIGTMDNIILEESEDQ